MVRALIIGIAMAIVAAGCGKKEESTTTETTLSTTTTPVPGAVTSESPPTHPSTTTPGPMSLKPVPGVGATQPETEPKRIDTSPDAVKGKAGLKPNRDEALALANRAGCLACHAVDHRVVGPAWQDVAAKYQGDGAAFARLVEKVKKGGKGNWTEVTGGVSMPPYSPRVADQDIEVLVRFVLSL